MQCNVGRNDRALRILAAVIIFAAGYWFKSWWGLIGILPLATGLLRWCPLYNPLKINTAGKS